MHSIEDLPDGAQFNTLGFGRHQLPFATTGILFGGHRRVGLKDNIYYESGELATSNEQLVDRITTIADTLGRDVATPSHARDILCL